MKHLFVTIIGLACMGFAGSAEAQPRTAMIQTQVGEESLASLAAAVDRVVRGRAQRLGVVEFTASPALQLEDIRLMVGCLADSVDCYRAFAEQLEVEALLIPSVVIAEGEAIVSVTFFDGARITQESRHARSSESESLIASLDGLLRELFDLPPADIDGPVEDPVEPLPPARETVSPVGPVVGSIGAAALIAALGVGLAANTAEDEYRSAPVGTVDEIDAALDLRSEARTKARAANALIGVGAALLATGVILTILLKRETASDVQVGAAVTPRGAGLSIGGRL